MPHRFDPLRRSFLRQTLHGSLISGGVPAFFGHSLLAKTAHASQSNTDRILIVLQMAGGNDGLNTVVPYEDDHYRRARPKLGLRKEEVIPIKEGLGLHPALTGFRDLYERGHLCIVQGVGYENPNRSHFKATEIWQTASDGTHIRKQGWLGRYLDLNCAACEATVAVTIGQQVPQALYGDHPWGLCLDEGSRLGSAKGSKTMGAGAELGVPDEEENSGDSIGMLSGMGSSGMSPLEFIARTGRDAAAGAALVEAAVERARIRGNYPNAPIGHSMRRLAELIGGGFPAGIYYVSQGGYDTHVNQRPTHARLLKQMGASVSALFTDLAAQGKLDQVLLLTFSEFGRRLGENASGGTDHGATAPLFVMGGKVKGGLAGAPPSLAPADLLLGDPVFTTDYRSVYAGVIEQWLGVPSAPVLERASVWDSLNSSLDAL